MTARTFIFLSACAALSLLGSACRTASTEGSQAAPRRAAAPAARQSLDVFIEEGRPSEMESRQYQYRCELRDYMRTELPRRFAKYGYDVRMLGQRSEHAPAAGRHLLVIRYDAYNPGSNAARIVVGFGAGACALDLTATLHTGGAEALSWKDGCGTSGHWSRLVNKLDDNLAKKLQAHFAGR